MAVLWYFWVFWYF